MQLFEPGNSGKLEFSVMLFTEERPPVRKFLNLLNCCSAKTTNACRLTTPPEMIVDDSVFRMYDNAVFHKHLPKVLIDKKNIPTIGKSPRTVDRDVNL